MVLHYYVAEPSVFLIAVAQQGVRLRIAKSDSNGTMRQMQLLSKEYFRMAKSDSNGTMRQMQLLSKEYFRMAKSDSNGTMRQMQLLSKESLRMARSDSNPGTNHATDVAS